MVFQHIEKLKQEYTDKYVVVDETRPELARFKNQTGIVRTVNMSGRALVEFDAYANIGWFDIDVDFLKIIDKPLEPEAKPAAKPAAAKPKAAEAGKAAGGKMSVQDMLAAARAEKESAAKPAEPAKPAAKMSVADMLAAARAEKSGEAPAAEATPAEPPSAPAEAPPVEAPPAEATAAAEETPAAKQDIPSDIPGILAYCRKVDG